MLDTLTKFSDAPARALLALIFFMSGYAKIGGFEGTMGYMEAFGVPGVLLGPTIVFEIGAGVMLTIGLWTRHVALLLAGFSLLTAIVFHMDFDDRMQQITFMKNLAIAGGLLVLAKYEAPSLSLDGYLAKRKAT